MANILVTNGSGKNNSFPAPTKTFAFPAGESVHENVEQVDASAIVQFFETLPSIHVALLSDEQLQKRKEADPEYQAALAKQNAEAAAKAEEEAKKAAEEAQRLAEEEAEKQRLAEEKAKKAEEEAAEKERLAQEEAAKAEAEEAAKAEAEEAETEEKKPAKRQSRSNKAK